MLELVDLSCGYKTDKNSARTVLERFSARIGEGEIRCVLGANGIGKTTLFKTILGALAPLEGSITLNGREITTVSQKELAKELAYVPQYHTPPFAFTVKEVALMGRNAYIGAFGAPSREDNEVVEDVLEELGIEELSDKLYTRISGGERQMVLIARAIAQRPGLILMDEPASNLDYGNQARILRQIRKLADEGISVLFTSHHPEHALMCRASVTAIISGNCFVTGPAEEVITPRLLEEIYGVKAKIIETEDYAGRKIKSVIPML